MKIIFELHERITGDFQNRIGNFFKQKQQKVQFIRPGNIEAIKARKRGDYIACISLSIDEYLARKSVRHSVILFQDDQRREQNIIQRGDSFHRLFHSLPGKRGYSMEQVCDEILQESKKRLNLGDTTAIINAVQLEGELPTRFAEILKDRVELVKDNGEFKFIIEPEKGMITGDEVTVLSNDKPFLDVNLGIANLITYDPFIYDAFSNKVPTLYVKPYLNDEYKYDPEDSKQIYSTEWSGDKIITNYEKADYIATSDFLTALKFAYCGYPIITPKHKHFAPISSFQQDPWDYDAFIENSFNKLNKSWRTRRTNYVKEEYDNEASCILWEAAIQSLFCKPRQ